jgi:hypothetical protein
MGTRRGELPLNRHAPIYRGRSHLSSSGAGSARHSLPYQMERLRSDVAITVSGKRPVTIPSAEATARQGRSRFNCSLLLQAGTRCLQHGG